MADFRSNSCRENRMQIETKPTPANMRDLRSYTVSHGGSVQPNQVATEVKMKKSKSNFGNSKSWSFNDPELQRKTRVAGYKVYSVEGKMKGSVRKSFRWIKNTCTQVVYGWR